MGPPGGGKVCYADDVSCILASLSKFPQGTISKKILQDFNFDHLSTGDVLRKHVRESTPIGMEAKGFMEAGLLVPDELIIRLVLDEVQKNGYNRLLLDGFPRTVPQAEKLEQYLSVDLAINLDVPVETIVERISNRWIHLPSGSLH